VHDSADLRCGSRAAQQKFETGHVTEKPPSRSRPRQSAAIASPVEGAPSLENSAGRVTFDSRGNAVWEWRAGDGEFQKDASTSMVRALQPDGLSLESTTRILRLIAGPAPASAPDAPSVAVAQSRGDFRALVADTPGSGPLEIRQPGTPAPGRESSGFDPYDSGRSVGHTRGAARRPVVKPMSRPVGPEKKSLFSRLTRRKP
jgi:hypothetical protein